MEDEKLKKYVINSIISLKELARKANMEAYNSKKDFGDYFSGVVMGYYSIISLFKHQAYFFCVDQKELGLADIIPDRDLLGVQSNPDLWKKIKFMEDNWAIDEMTNEKLEFYLGYSIELLKEQAKEARQDADHPKEGYEDYTKGELMAYCSTFALLKRQALAFNIDAKAIGLDDLELYPNNLKNWDLDRVKAPTYRWHEYR